MVVWETYHDCDPIIKLTNRLRELSPMRLNTAINNHNHVAPHSKVVGSCWLSYLCS